MVPINSLGNESDLLLVSIQVSRCIIQSRSSHSRPNNNTQPSILSALIKCRLFSAAFKPIACTHTHTHLGVAGGLSTVRPAPLWLFSEFGAVYKYSDLLTYLGWGDIFSCVLESSPAKTVWQLFF